MSGTLGGVVVLDLGRELFAALAAAMLGDFGATVIRVEDLGAARPDPDRDGMQPHGDALAELAHRNKQSLAVDLGQPAGREILAKLVPGADVFLTDLPFADLAGRGLDYDSLCRLRPDLVYARGSGFGPRGPDRELPALDELAAARTGLMPTLGEPGQPPIYAGAGQMHAAVMLALGVAMALYHRDATGEGQLVDASLFAGNLYAASLDLQAYLAVRADRLLQPVSRLDKGNPMSGPSYACSDGRWVTLAMPDTDRWWPLFSQVVGLDPGDPRFDSHEKRCGESRLEMMRVLDGLFSRMPASHWQEQFARHRMSADVIETYDYPVGDPQALRNRYVLELERPGLGRVRSLGFPVSMSESPARLERIAPALGQHTEAVLRERLGYGDAEIRRLAESGVVRAV